MVAISPDMMLGFRRIGKIGGDFVIEDNSSNPLCYGTVKGRCIIHIGVSNFHRSHQAVYFAELMQANYVAGWSMRGAGVLGGDEQVINTLVAQNCTYSATAIRSDGERSVSVLRAHSDIASYANRAEDLIDTMADSRVKIVSLTVTEGGYYLTPDRIGIDLSHPDIATDLEGKDAPRTYVAMIVEALRRRYEAGDRPFTVMSCDNLQANGDTCREVVSGYAAVKDAEFGEWIRTRGAFPNSMVDRITPAPPESHRDWLLERFGLKDDVPVISEDYRRWVLEDRFVDGRPDWEKVGVELVSDVKPYEEMKLRILNASHQAIAYLSHLLGFEYVHQAVTDDRIRAFLREFVLKESIPTLGIFSNETYRQYFSEILLRFENVDLRDRIDRLCWSDETMVSTFILPIIRDDVRQKIESRIGPAILATWADYVSKQSTVQKDQLCSDDPIVRIESELVACGDVLEKYRRWRDVLNSVGVRRLVETVAK